jgi:hypothetical protein
VFRRAIYEPFDDFLIQALEAVLHRGDIHMFAPGLLAFAGRLVVLLRSAGRSGRAVNDRHFDQETNFLSKPGQGRSMLPDGLVYLDQIAH